MKRRILLLLISAIFYYAVYGQPNYNHLRKILKPGNGSRMPNSVYHSLGIYSTLGNGEWVCMTTVFLSNNMKSLLIFHPIAYNPDEWVLMAKEAGMNTSVLPANTMMGLLCFTQKFHPNVVDRTPYGKI
jgi:hypothetical protein